MKSEARRFSHALVPNYSRDSNIMHTKYVKCDEVDGLNHVQCHIPQGVLRRRTEKDIKT